MAAVDAADLTEPPEPPSETRSRLFAAVAVVAGIVLLLALIRRRIRRGNDDSVFDLAEESAAALAEVLVSELLPG
jgi:hypothetical protein